MSTDTTQALKAISQLRDAFPQGSKEWIELCIWYQAVIELERNERQQEIEA